MIDEQRAERELHYLIETDDQAAEAKVEVERAEIVRQRVFARLFLAATGTVAERQAWARGHADTAAAEDRWAAALLAHERLRGRRQTATLVIDVYRTQEASRRRA